MKTTTNLGLKKIELSDSPPDITVQDSNWDLIDKQLYGAVKYQKAGGTGTAITLSDVTLSDGFCKTFIVTANNSGAATTINGKSLYKPGGTAAPSLSAGKAEFVWYDAAGDCFFIKANTEVATQSTDGFMSSADKTKLDGVAAGANNYVHPASHPASMVTEDSSHRFTTDAEKNTWNAKASTAIATQSVNGLMSSTDKAKLDGVAAGANNYTHPASHPASIITEDSLHRFTTDTEKSTWNAKASTAIATQSANGLMSSTDKAKLDGVAAGANNYVHPASHSASMITGLPTSLPTNGGNADTVDGFHLTLSTTIPTTLTNNVICLVYE
jgi:hypothetical protein